ncbi:MAG: hypothetical protein NT069_21140 [Planctomycetota bacterium]|nr:hypothetical protein [Planctomycetota bacterium]
MLGTTLLTFESPSQALQVRDSLRQIVGRSGRPAESGEAVDQVGEWQVRFGKTVAVINKGTSGGSVAIWDGDNVAGLADTGHTESAVSLLAAIGAGKWVVMLGFRWGYLIIAAECG